MTQEILSAARGAVGRLPRERRVSYSQEGGLRAGSEQDTTRARRYDEVLCRLTSFNTQTGRDMVPILSYIKEFYRALEQKSSHVAITVDIIGDNEGDNKAMVVTITRRNGEGTSDSRAPIFFGTHVDTNGATDTVAVIDTSDGIPTHRSSGKTGLGGDDKAAIAEILVATEEVVENDQDYRPLVIGFTTDEEDQSQTIKQIPTKGAQMGFIFDREGDPLMRGIVVGAYGYHRFDVSIPNLRGMQALEFVTRFSESIGSRLVGRRIFEEPFTFPDDVTVVIKEFAVRKTEEKPVDGQIVERNVVPAFAQLSGSLSFTGQTTAEEALRIFEERSGGRIIVLETKDRSLDFQIDFDGKGGHPSRDDLVTPLSNIEYVGRGLVGGKRAEMMLPSRREARFSVADVATEDGVTIKGEVRSQMEAQQETDKTLVLLRDLVELSGGKMDYGIENDPNRVPDNYPAVLLAERVLAEVALEEGFEGVNLEHVVSFGASDANNATIPIVVLSEGTEGAHTSGESVAIYRALSAMNIIRRLCTSSEALVN